MRAGAATTSASSEGAPARGERPRRSAVLRLGVTTRAALGALVALAALLLAGCAGHERRVQAALDALDRGELEAAVAALDRELEVASSDEVPESLTGDAALLMLDRATLLQALGRHAASARDFGLADQAIEVLDLSYDAADAVGRYLFSDSLGPYRAPAFEKLLVNSLNLVNYLELADLSGARVEARRLAVQQRFLVDHGERGALLGIGSYLAGFAFERSGARDEALAYYEDALGYARFPSLLAPLRVLTGGASRSQAIDALVADSGPLGSPAEAGEGELLVVVGYGRVPPKRPVRLPIGLALTLVAAHMSPHDHALATKLAAKGLVTWVNFPRLGPSRSEHEPPSFELDGAPAALEPAVDVEAEVRRAYDEAEPAIVLSALTRMLTRLAAGEAAGALTNAATKDKDKQGIAGLLVGLATTAALAAFDTPDTRSWTTLPARMALARLRVPAGKHRVRLRAGGLGREVTVDVGPGGHAFVSLVAPR
ncbi:MAG: hypothetical protein IT373_30690 [Polyangiaceae bacterium]|nr:hypothetical protein [Polyangiaceae bacterium]